MYDQPYHPYQQPTQAKAALPGIKHNVMLSIVWLVVSLFVVFVGGLHMHIHSYRYELKCTPTTCVYRSSVKPPVTFNRTEFVGSEIVQVSKKENDGVTLQLKYQSPAGSRFKVENTILFTPHGLGDKIAAKYYALVSSYTDKQIVAATDLFINSSSKITPMGFIALMGGLASAVMCLALGTFSNDSGRAKKNY